VSFDWGEEVRVSSVAPLDYRPGSKAWIVGMSTAEPTPASSAPNEEPTSYTIEFEDGSSVQVPAALLLSIGESEQGTQEI
jgi:hypothetical protein